MHSQSKVKEEKEMSKKHRGWIAGIVIVALIFVNLVNSFVCGVIAKLSPVFVVVPVVISLAAVIGVIFAVKKAGRCDEEENK